MHSPEQNGEDGQAAAPALARLAELVRAEGGLLAAALRPRPEGTAAHGDLVARGPLHRDQPAAEADLPLAVEAVREGYLMHGGTARILDDADRDLALLAGDHLYALGLERLAAAGALTAVAVLTDLIAAGAQARAAGDEELGEALWAAASVELGWGASPDLDAARAAARAGAPDAAQRLHAAARRLAGDLALAR